MAFLERAVAVDFSLGGRAQDLLPEDVRVAAMLSEFAQGVQVDPAQGQRSEAVPVNHVIQAEVGRGLAGRLARLGVCAADRLDGVCSLRMNASAARGGRPMSWRGRPVTASPNHTLSA